MDRIFTPEDLILLFQAINLEELDLILVSGQAIRLIFGQVIMLVAFQN
jgi:hypothetical protein